MTCDNGFTFTYILLSTRSIISISNERLSC